MRNKGRFETFFRARVKKVVEHGVIISNEPIDIFVHHSQVPPGKKSKFGKVLLLEEDQVDVRLLKVDALAGRAEGSMLAFQTPQDQENADAMATLARLKQEEEKDAGGKNALAAALVKAMREDR
mmetsp:Transcript_57622/g.137132  ORF Transcript_57622/g.137132 Transcript_57622/m.137132 type:complete len:124 (+) Transcript_57622:79-450(+)